MQATQVRAWIREDPTCRGATKPVRHNYWSPHATSPEAHAPTACALQQEKPVQWEARAPQCRVAPLTATRESPRAATKTQSSQKQTNK